MHCEVGADALNYYFTMVVMFPKRKSPTQNPEDWKFFFGDMQTNTIIARNTYPFWRLHFQKMELIFHIPKILRT
jgi:hypothetical protein